MKKNPAQVIKEMQQSVTDTISVTTTSDTMNKVISMLQATGAIVDVSNNGFSVLAIFVKDDMFFSVEPAQDLNPVYAFKYIAPPMYIASREGKPGRSIEDIPISNDEMLMKWANDVVGMIERRKTSQGWSKEMESEWRDRGIQVP
jgi:hypothetical protein